MRVGWIKWTQSRCNRQCKVLYFITTTQILKKSSRYGNIFTSTKTEKGQWGPLKVCPQTNFLSVTVQVAPSGVDILALKKSTLAALRKSWCSLQFYTLWWFEEVPYSWSESTGYSIITTRSCWTGVDNFQLSGRTGLAKSCSHSSRRCSAVVPAVAKCHFLLSSSDVLFSLCQQHYHCPVDRRP